MFDFGFADDLLERRGEILKNDDRFRTGIIELMLKFARRVQRIDVDDRVPCAQDRRDRDGILQHVRHHDGHARAFFQARTLQPCTEFF